LVAILAAVVAVVTTTQVAQVVLEVQEAEPMELTITKLHHRVLPTQAVAEVELDGAVAVLLAALAVQV
jgi:hypothetical protein